MTQTCDTDQACTECGHDLDQHDYSNDLGWLCLPRQVHVVGAPTLFTARLERRNRRAEVRAQRNERRTR